MTQLISVKEASRYVGKSEQMIRKLINDGKVKSFPQNGRHMVDANELLSLYQHSANSRRGATSSSNSNDANQLDASRTQMALLERQLQMMERELDYSKTLLRDEREARNRLENEMTAIVKEIKAVLDGQNQNVLSRFFKK